MDQKIFKKDKRVKGVMSLEEAIADLQKEKEEMDKIDRAKEEARASGMSSSESISERMDQEAGKYALFLADKEPEYDYKFSEEIKEGPDEDIDPSILYPDAPVPVSRDADFDDDLIEYEFTESPCEHYNKVNGFDDDWKNVDFNPSDFWDGYDEGSEVNTNHDIEIDNYDDYDDYMLLNGGYDQYIIKSVFEENPDIDVESSHSGSEEDREAVKYALFLAEHGKLDEDFSINETQGYLEDVELLDFYDEYDLQFSGDVDDIFADAKREYYEERKELELEASLGNTPEEMEVYVNPVHSEVSDPWDLVDYNPSDFWEGYDDESEMEDRKAGFFQAPDPSDFRFDNHFDDFNESIDHDAIMADLFNENNTDLNYPFTKSEFLNKHNIKIMDLDNVEITVKKLSELRGRYGFLDYILDYVKDNPNDYRNTGELIRFIDDFYSAVQENGGRA